MDEANAELGISLPEDDDYETVAGFLLSRLGRIPKEGEGYRYGDLQLTVAEMEGPKITKVLVRWLKSPHSEAEE